MKVLLTGSTGLVGGEVLRQVLAHPSITEAVVLARRAIADPTVAKDPKLTTVIITDFGKYDADTIEKCKGAEACIWALGDVKNRDNDYQMKTRRDWPYNSAEVFAKQVVPQGKPFRFVLTSGFITEHDQDRNLWIMADMRKQAGLVEIGFVDLSKKFPSLECFVTRPARVMGFPRTFASRLISNVFPSIGAEELAATMIDVALNGSKKQFFQNTEMGEMGRQILQKQ